MRDVNTPHERSVPRRGRRSIRVAVTIVALVLVVFAVLYVRLLFGPISLNFLSDRVQGMVASVVEDSFEVQWQEFGLALSDPASLAFRLSDVDLRERASDAVISMEALEVGIAPLGALHGRPGARVTLVEPEFQMVQDLLGPRLSRFEFMEEEATGEIVAQVIEGDTVNPSVRIGDAGLQFETPEPEEAAMRSGNDWLIYNIEAINDSLADLADQAMAGQIERVAIRDGKVGVLDTVYGLYKEFGALDVEIRSGREDGRVSAIFSTTIADRTMHGTIVRRMIDGVPQIDAQVEGIDFASLIPFLDDAQALAALRGAGGLGLSIAFTGQGEELAVDSGTFTVDLNGTDLRLNNDQFEVSAPPFEVAWDAAQARFLVEEADLTVGQTRGTVSGDLVLGLDRRFGPTIGMSIKATDVWLHPDDLEAPAEPFEAFTFEGWAAPLYGALGVDRLVGAKDGVSVVVQGRIDAVREGVGLDMTVSGRGASADDLKRLWPHIFAPEARSWFTEYVNEGTVDSADMRFNFPVGTVATNGEKRPVPDGSISIDLVGREVDLQPFQGLPQFEVAGESRVTVRDNQFTMSFERATVPGPAGNVAIANAAFINQDTAAAEQVFEISGDISGTVPALMSIANREPLNLLKDFQFGIDLDVLAENVMGQVDTTVIATIATDDTGRMIGTDYALNGTIANLRTTSPVEGLNFDETALSFTASQEGFRVVGSGLVQDIPLDLQATKSGDAAPEILIGSTVSVEDVQSFGVDLSEFMQGQARLIARPVDEGRFEITADLTQTALTIRDIGVTKARGVPGAITATIGIEDETVTVTDVDLGFGDVRLAGDLSVSTDGDLISADFETFQISPGDSATVSMQPNEGGFSLTVRGEQLDIKPVLKRFFNLEGDSNAAPSEDLQNQIFNVSVELDRALGYFGTAAFNLDLDLSVRGDELRRVNLSGQVGENRSVSATTNSTPEGRVITYASNDVGSVLRFIGIYPRVVEGTGSLVMRYDSETQTDTGEFQLRNFAIADERNLQTIVGAHQESGNVLGQGNFLEFDFGRARFVRFPDRIEVVEAALYGDTVGGTIRGNILTNAGEYDLAGTYVPLFGLNNVFQQLPILGPIFGGREGEGLIGVTFAVRGPLNSPDLLVNPVSILAPGVFRTLFEYRAQAQQTPQ